LLESALKLDNLYLKSKKSVRWSSFPAGQRTKG
jgi:hypothetical protein